MSKLSWLPSATLENLRQRAKIIQSIRAFFYQKNYLEVETPIMGSFPVTDVYLTNIEAVFQGRTYYLQTSPEYHMKRLLAAGSGSIFQIARVFRDDELGRWHNPEFTLLEWYQLDKDHHGLMDEVNELLQSLLDCPPMIRKTYQEVFRELCDINPLNTTVKELKDLLSSYELDNVLPENEQDIDQYLFLLMSHVIEPALAKLGVPIAIYAFPPSQAALAKINQGVAERFEIYYQGVELANGFHELTDAKIQEERLHKDISSRQERNLAEKAIDSNFLAALAHGLPACSGVALGIDRLIALVLKQPNIAEVMAFDISRA